MFQFNKLRNIYSVGFKWGQRSGWLKVIANNKLTCVHAEHSIYFFAPIFRARSSPSSVFIGFDFWLPCDHFIGWTFRSSDWRPTRIIGTFGANSRNSGTHFSLTFWNEIWSTRLKQRRNIFVCGYASLRITLNCSYKKNCNDEVRQQLTISWFTYHYDR